MGKESKPGKNKTENFQSRKEGYNIGWKSYLSLWRGYTNFIVGVIGGERICHDEFLSPPRRMMGLRSQLTIAWMA
jgi:hypothetical protein